MNEYLSLDDDLAVCAWNDLGIQLLDQLGEQDDDDDDKTLLFLLLY